MKRTFAAMFTAVVLAFGFSVAAQQTHPGTFATPNGKRGQVVTITGCVQKTKSGAYFLTNAHVQKGQSKAPMGSAYNATNVWNLRGGKDLEGYVGKKVQVTGTPEQTRTNGELLNQGGGSESLKARNFEIKSATAIASSCE